MEYQAHAESYLMSYRALSPRVKRREGEPDLHLVTRLRKHSPTILRYRYLVKHRGKFTFTN
jgi:hypothetical protein